MSELKFSVVTYQDFPKICRTCSIGDSLVPISNTFIADIQVEDLLKNGVGLNYEEEDYLPQNICQDCITNLHTVYTFQKLCQENVERLRVLLENYTKGKEGFEPEEVINLQVEKTENDALDVKQEPAAMPVKTLPDLTIGEMAAIEDSHYMSNVKVPKKIAPEKKVACTICSKTVGRSKMRLHMMLHTGEKSYLCTKCPKRFRCKQNLHRHELCHSTFFPFLCRFCGRMFRQSTKLKEHEKWHQKLNSKKCPTWAHTCSECGRIFKSETIYKMHLSKHFEPAAVNPLKCKFCDREFKNKNAFYSHLTKHDEPKIFCEVCYKEFRYPSELKLHKLKHTGEKPHKCTLCTKGFASSQALRVHLLTHTDQRDFKCSICQMSFRQRPHLKTHLLLHTGDKPHQCSYCGASFTQKGNLVVHIRTHTNEKPYVCGVCDKGFPDSSSLKKHSRTHVVDTPTDLCGEDTEYIFKEDTDCR